MHQVVAVATGLLVIVAGAAIVRFRVPLSRFFMRRRERQGLPINAMQSPLSGLVVGLGWIAVGFWMIIGTAAGRGH